jgi:hypothetical protein
MSLTLEGRKRYATPVVPNRVFGWRESITLTIVSQALSLHEIVP